jgi:host factor-I protein
MLGKRPFWFIIGATLTRHNKQAGNPTVNTKKQESIQDTFLQKMQDDKSTVHIFLVSGIKLVGKIVGFDQYAIQLQNGSTQVVFKRAVSTVMPATSTRPAV